MIEENWFCECDKVTISYAVLSDIGCWEVCCSCKKVIKESYELYDSYNKIDENEFAKHIYEDNIGIIDRVENDEIN
jgi:hypothetical protein